MPQFTVASYNIHGFVGTDGIRDPDRTAKVIHELEADPIGLQEVDVADGRPDAIDLISRANGFTAIRGPTIFRENGHYGNVLLTRRPVRDIRLVDLSVPGREPRGAIDAAVELEGMEVRVIVTHFGLNALERLTQARLLLDGLDRSEPSPMLVLGDINEWLPFGRAVRALRASLGKSSPRRTFPARLPVLPLDRIWVWPRDSITKTRVHKTRLARTASDHLPVVATIAL